LREGCIKKDSLSTLTLWNTALKNIETYVAHSSTRRKMYITAIHQESEDRCCNLLDNKILLQVLMIWEKLNKQGWFGWQWYGEAPPYIITQD